MIPGNDQNTIPTNQGAIGSELDRTSQLTFNGSQGASEKLLVYLNLFTSMCFQVLGEIFFN